MSSEVTLPEESEKVFDMVSRDLMLGGEYESTLTGDSTEVSFASQYMPISTSLFTSADDVFLPSMPVTMGSNTIVNPLNTFVTKMPVGETSNAILRPSPRPASSTLTNDVSLYFAANLAKHVKDTFATEPVKSRKTTTKSSTKKSSSKSQASLSIGRTPKPTRSSSNKRIESSPHTSADQYSEQRKLFVGSSRQSAFVPTYNRSGTVTTQTITRPIDMFTKSSVALDAEMLKSSTVPRPGTYQSLLRSYLTEETIKSFTAANTQSSSTTELLLSPNLTNISWGSLNNRPTERRAIISPKSMLYTKPTIRTPSITTGVGHSSDEVSEQCTLNPSQSASAIPIGTTSDTSLMISADELAPSITRFVIPYTSSHESIVTTIAAQNSYGTAGTLAAGTTAPGTLTHNTFALSPSTTLFAAKRDSTGRITRSLTAPRTKESQMYTISDGKGSYTTLTISSDLMDSGAVQPAQRALPQGVCSHTPTQSQFIIPIANSQMNTSTSLGYLVTPPQRSDITAGSAAAAASNKSASRGSHTIATITSEALKRIRSRLIIPVAHNVPSTDAGSGLLPPKRISTDTGTTRLPLTILTKRHISTGTPNDRSELSMREAAANMVRNLQNLYGLSAPSASYEPSPAVESTARPASQMVIPIISSVHPTSKSLGLTTTMGATCSVTTRAVPATPVPGSFVFADNKGLFSDGTTTPIISSRGVVPMMQNTTVTATVDTNTRRPLPGTARGYANLSSIGNTDPHPKLRSLLSPTDHQFEEPQPMSRLREYPARRTYPVAQRSASGQVVQPPAAPNVKPRAPAQRCLTSPAPLQIFTDVVCPPTNTQSRANASMPGHSNRRFTYSHGSGTSTSAAAQYKHTMPKHSSTSAPPNPERASSRLSTQRSSSDRSVSNRPVAVATSRRSAPGTQGVCHGAQTAGSTVPHTSSRTLRSACANPRCIAGRTAAASALSPSRDDALRDHNLKK